MSGLIDPTQNTDYGESSPSMVSLTIQGLQSIIDGMKREGRRELSLRELEMYVDRLHAVDELLKGGGDITLEKLDRLRSMRE